MLPKNDARRTLLLSSQIWLSFARLLVVALIPTSICAFPQSQPTLQITSPSGGTVVNPGQTLTVSVTSPTPAAFTEVDLYGDKLGFVGTFSSLPGQVSVTIPSSQIDCGSYFLTVSGTPTSGQGPVSAIVELDVERSDFPLTISAALSTIIFDSAGEQIRLDLLAGFADGTTFGVTASSYVTYSSSNTAVATVDSTGLVTAVAPGSGSIAVTYALGSNNNQIFVPVSVPNPTITNLSPGSGAVGTSVTVTGTNFGASQGTSTVTFNGTAATPNWSATSIAVLVPSGATTGNVVVTVGGHASNGVSFTVTGTPPRSIALVQHATHEETHERI
jgi:IPT/TIG domain/Bacterial Ig-like domain (group 2)